MKRAYLGGGRSREDDRISELPDNIIHGILELLQSPMEAAKSMLLSRRWFHIWRSYPVLEFHCRREYFYSAKLRLFFAAAAKRLSSSENNRIKALRISSRRNDFISDMLDLVLSREPEEIVVEGYYKNENPPKLLATDLINNHKLRILDLEACKFWEYQDTNHLDMRMINLRVLRLKHVSVDEPVLNWLIAACPLLEEFKLSNHKETSRRLRIRIHICNNPNLKILQIEECRVEELTIAETTKSLEILSIDCTYLSSFLDISPSQLTSLKSLKISSAFYKLTGEFINNMIANLPSLQSLCLSNIEKLEELKIRSDTLQQVELKHCSVRKGIYIDAPRLVDVHYQLHMSCLPAAITHRSNLREAKLCTFTVFSYAIKTVLKMDAFIKLKDFVAKLRQQFRSVQLRFYLEPSLLSLHGDVVDRNHDSPIPMIDNVKFEFDLTRMDCKGRFIDALFWSCRPKYLCLMHSKELYQFQGCSSLMYMAESFINRRNNDNCCKSRCKCWRHQLKDVKIVSRKEDEGDEQLSYISKYLDWPYTEEECVWLKLLWR